MDVGEAKKLEGIFTPLLVPLDERDRVNEPEFRRFVSWLIERGVHGVYPNGSTGEFTRFTAEERRRIVQVVAEECGGRVPILAGAAEANVKETLAACEAYVEMGARAVAIVAPFYYKLTPESVYAYFAEIARNSPIDITLYNIPMFASPIDVPTIQRLACEFPRVIGIKDSSGDLGFMMRMIAAVRPHRPDFSFLTGWEAVLVPMLMIGCDGGTHASSNVVPEITRRMYDLYRSGDHAAAMRWQFSGERPWNPFWMASRSTSVSWITPWVQWRFSNSNPRKVLHGAGHLREDVRLHGRQMNDVRPHRRSGYDTLGIDAVKYEYFALGS